VEGVGYELLGDVTGYEVHESFVVFECGRAKLRLAAVTPRVVRVTLAPDGEFWEGSYAVVWRGEERVEVDDRGEFVEVRTGLVVARVSKRPCRVSFYDSGGRLLCSDYEPLGMGWAPSRWRGHRVKCWKRLSMDDHFYGLGEKALPLDRRRARVVMWNTDAPGYDLGTDPLYMSVPFLICLRRGVAYGIFFDNTYRSVFDLGHTSEEYYSFEAEGGALDYYFIYGPSVRGVVEEYTRLTGRMPLPPLWALGHQQSRYSYYPESRVLEVARRYREEGIPCDVLYLDIHYMDGYRVFTWDRSRFPDPRRMVEELGRLGFKVVAIVDPGVKLDPSYHVFREGVLNDYFCRRPNGDLYVGRVWPGLCAFPDFTKPEVRRWWGDLHRVLVEAGVAGVWNDMNEPSIFDAPEKTMDPDVVHAGGPHAEVHNVYALLEAQATYEGLLRLRPGVRPFVLTRAGFAGVQRYAAKWTGDNVSNWRHLWLQIPMLLNLGLSGVPFVGADVGGFMGNPTPELIVRWYQVAAFMPLCRNHQCIGSYDHEPWMYGSEAKRAIREVLELRYRLLPYIYSLFYEHYLRGYPVVRPLLFEFQEDEDTYLIDDEFMLGSWILVAPVLREGARAREVYLPSGLWYDFWTDEVHRGPARVHVEAPLSRVPLFVRAGAVVPMWPPMQFVGERRPEPLFLHAYAGASGAFTLYEDDGETLNYLRGERLVTKLSLEDGGREVVLRAERLESGYEPPREHVVAVFHGVGSAARVLFDGSPLPRVESLEEVDEGYTMEGGRLVVKVREPRRSFEIRVVRGA